MCVSIVALLYCIVVAADRDLLVVVELHGCCCLCVGKCVF